jgi:hypothetical protein
MLQGNDHGCPTSGTVLPLLFLLRIALGFTDIDPGCLQMMGIALLPGKQVPVHVGNLVAKKLVIHLAWLDYGVDGFGHHADFVHQSKALFGGEIEQFGDMPFGVDDAVAFVELPGAEKGDRFLELPDQFFAVLIFGMFNLVADNAGRFDRHDQLPSGLGDYRMEARGYAALPQC